MTIEDFVDRFLALVHRVFCAVLPPLNLQQTESKLGVHKRPIYISNRAELTENGYLQAIMDTLDGRQLSGDAPVPAFIAIALLVAFPGSIAFDSRTLGRKYRFHGGRFECEDFRGGWLASACPSRTYAFGPREMYIHLE